MVLVRKAECDKSLSLSFTPSVHNTNIYEVFGEVKVQLSDACTWEQLRRTTRWPVATLLRVANPPTLL